MKVKLGKEQKVKTGIKKNTLNPRFNETFDLMVYERSVEVTEPSRVEELFVPTRFCLSMPPSIIAPPSLVPLSSCPSFCGHEVTDGSSKDVCLWPRCCWGWRHHTVAVQSPDLSLVFALPLMLSCLIFKASDSYEPLPPSCRPS